MDDLRVKKLKARFPVEAAKLKAIGKDTETAHILAILDLDQTLGFAATEYVDTMAGEPLVDVFKGLMTVIESFTQRAQEMFPGLTEEHKVQLLQTIKEKVCQTNRKG